MDLISKKREALAELEDRREMMEGANAERRKMFTKMVIASIVVPGLAVMLALLATFATEAGYHVVGEWALIFSLFSVLATLLVWLVTAIVALMSAGGAAVQEVGEGRRLRRERRALVESVDASHGLTIARDEEGLRGALSPQASSGALTDAGDVMGGDDG